MAQQSKRKKAIPIVCFVLVTLALWLPTVTHHFGGFVALTGAQAVGFDGFTLLVWAAFLYSAWNLFRAFRADLAQDLIDRISKKALDADTAKRLLEKHLGDWNEALADAEEQGYRVSSRWRERADLSRSGQ